MLNAYNVSIHMTGASQLVPKLTRTQYQHVPKLTRTHYQLVSIQLVPKSTRTQFVLIQLAFYVLRINP